MLLRLIIVLVTRVSKNVSKKEILLTWNDVFR